MGFIIGFVLAVLLCIALGKVIPERHRALLWSVLVVLGFLLFFITV